MFAKEKDTQLNPIQEFSSNMHRSESNNQLHSTKNANLRSKIKKEKRSLIPAVTHVDGTGRLQTVDALISPRYYNLIEAFREKTGIPILLNTSFNENEPIVNTPAEALNCYLRTNTDMLVMENILITR